MNVNEGFRDRRVVIAGLGCVAVTLAVAMAEEGFQVHGIQIREDVLEELAQGGRQRLWPRSVLSAPAFAFEVCRQHVFDRPAAGLHR